MRKFIFILFLLFSASLQAQNSNEQKGFAVTLAGALIPISQPGLGIQPGVEYRFNGRYSLLAEATIRVNNKNSKDSSELNKQYFRFKSELRYSLSGKNKKNHMYTGLQVSGSSRKFINQNSFYYDSRNTDSGYYYTKASINSPVTTVSLQFGSIIAKGKFAVDLFTGIGARFIHTTIAGIENPTRSAIRKPDSGPSFTASYSYAGNIIMLHLNGGIRLMWQFYQVKHPQKK
jgi:hypothetical protein